MTDQDAPHRGWGLVLALSIAQLISWGALYYVFSLFVGPMEAELGWSRATLNGAFSAGLLISGLCAGPVGAWIDRRGGRGLMTVGSLLASAALFLWSQTESVASLYAAWILMGAALSAVLYEPAFAVISANLGRDYRSAITAVTLVGGFASTVFVPLAHVLIEAQGWRMALAVLGGINLVVCGGIHAFVLRGTRIAPRALPVEDPVSPGRTRTPLQVALRTRAFWGLTVAFCAQQAVVAAVVSHIVPLASERGLSIDVTVGALALFGPMQVLGRVLLLAVGPRMTALQIGRSSSLLLPMAIGSLLLLPPSALSLGVFSLFYGFGNGMMTIVRGTAVPELLGREGYGAINGAIASPTVVSRALAPAAVAGLWTLTQNYGPVLWVMMLLALGGAVAFWIAAASRPATA